MEGGDEKSVVSKVILRMSHFRRDEARASFWVAREAGGWMRENADESKEWVSGTSRWRKARAARG